MNRRGDTTIKLHGDLADPDTVVLSRSDYRRRLYEDGSYIGFLRTLFLFDTVLYLGFSFKDNYINELRSEVLATLGSAWKERPQAYVITDNMHPLREEFLRGTEGLHVLTYDRGTPVNHLGFDAYLQAIHDATNPARRLGTLLKGRRILWVTSTRDSSSFVEGTLFEEARQACGGHGATVDYVANTAEALERLSSANASDYSLVITRWDEEHQTGVSVLRGLRGMGAEVPVFVFAGNKDFAARKQAAMRLGAAGYYWSWDGLLRGVEQVLDTDPANG